jgi:hypothetical protein
MSIFRKPAEAMIGLKVLVYGGTGSGKSTFGLSFPKIAAIDSEAGLARYENNPNIVFIANTSSVESVEEAIDELEDNVGVIDTFVIDSETKIYDSMQVSSMEVEERRARKKGGDVADATISVKTWGKIKLINKKLQNLKIDLSSKGVHIVSVSQMEDIKEKQGDNFVKIGDKPSMAKGIEYDYDIVLKLFTKKKGKEEELYYALVEKDRTGVTKKGQIIENPSFKYWEKYCEDNSKNETRPTDFKNDVSKDVDKLVADENKIPVLLEELKKSVVGLTDEQKEKVSAKSKELGITNAFKTTDDKALEKLVKFVKTL